MIDTGKPVIFVLTYNEASLWIKNYPVDSFLDKFSNYTFIFLDNGNQTDIKEWCKQTGCYYYASTRNIGSTGGYNWIFRVADLLDCERAVLTQADVEIIDTGCLDILFDSKWEKDHVPFYPQVDKTFWDNNGQVYNLGQLFSFNPKFILFNNFTNDENYVVTHYDDADLARRMRDWGVRLINCAKEYYPDLDCVPNNESTHEFGNIYKIHHYSSQKQPMSDNHQSWLDHNYQYHETKWGGNGMPNQYPFSSITAEDAKQLLAEVHSDKLNELQKFNINQMEPHSHRWTSLGYVPYPVEHEVNMFWLDYIKQLGIMYYDTKNT